MPKRKIVRHVSERDADTDGFYDVRVDMETLRDELDGEVSLAQVCRRTGDEPDDAMRTHVPGAYLDLETGTVSINNGYDPDEPAGRLERLIWDLVAPEVTAEIAKMTGRELETVR